MSPPVPRVFIIRHGETAWSLSGRHTGTTDIPLTSNGEKRVRATAHALIGPDRLIVPQNLAAIFVSPRTRAQKTLQLLFNGTPPVPSHTRDEIAEWNYGAYEGITTHAINAQRDQAGQAAWSIWRDGCPGGESPQEVTERCDELIAEIRERFHQPALEHAGAGGGRKECPPCDVLVVAHGHILRSLAARWVGRGVEEGARMLLEAGGVGTLSYEHHSIEEPAVVLGGAFVVGD